MENKIGFYGTGNMGRAMIQGLLAAKLYAPENILIYDAYQPVMEQLAKDLAVTPVKDAHELARETEVIIFAVKPYILPELLTELKADLAPDQLLISVAAGVSLATIQGKLSPEHKVIRVMPNTPALVGEGMSAVAPNNQVTAEEAEQVKGIFSSFGKAELVPESMIDAVVGVSGSAPAYVYMFIEALADGAVLEGMPRDKAYEFAAQTVLGSAKMVMETGKHPGELKDMVCSPGGTTIAAVASLEADAFRSAVVKAVKVAAEKNRELS